MDSRLLQLPLGPRFVLERPLRTESMTMKQTLGLWFLLEFYIFKCGYVVKVREEGIIERLKINLVFLKDLLE